MLLPTLHGTEKNVFNTVSEISKRFAVFSSLSLILLFNPEKGTFNGFQ